MPPGILPWEKNEDDMKPFFVCFYPVPVEKKKEEKKKEEPKPQTIPTPLITSYVSVHLLLTKSNPSIRANIFLRSNILMLNL
jgi:hypothetical protein